MDVGIAYWSCSEFPSSTVNHLCVWVYLYNFITLACVSTTILKFHHHTYLMYYSYVRYIYIHTCSLPVLICFMCLWYLWTFNLYMNKWINNALRNHTETHIHTRTYRWVWVAEEGAIHWSWVLKTEEEEDTLNSELHGCSGLGLQDRASSQGLREGLPGFSILFPPLSVPGKWLDFSRPPSFSHHL